MLDQPEYKGPRPGCFWCKKPIHPTDADYFKLQWVGRTWDNTQNYHLGCLQPAVASMTPEELGS